MDELDRVILRELQNDGRVPYRKIAKINGISIGTVHNRIKKLQENGILKGFVPKIDPEHYGYTMTAIFLIKVKGGILEEVTRELLVNYPEINLLYNISGVHDIIGIVKFKGMLDFTNFTNRISRIKDIQIETNLVMAQKKEDCAFILDEMEIKS